MKDTNNTVQFRINGKEYEVDRDVDANTRLVDFLRRTALLTGTKWMCREGGCGACVVTQITHDPDSGRQKYRAVNSCLLPLLSCHGTEIITVEGLGNRRDGYHPVQLQLADGNGSQCGYCSPGMVMSMYSLLEKKEGDNISMKDVETILDGNICRCTGYRPIMDAFKSFAKDAPAELKSASVDLEDLGRTLRSKTCPRSGQPCAGTCDKTVAQNGHCNGQVASDSVFQFGNWYRPTSLDQLTQLLRSFDEGFKYRFVLGNTGTGVFKHDGPYDAYIDINHIPDLHQIELSTPLTIGGATTLSHIQETLGSVVQSNPDYWYGAILAEHIGKIGSVPLRNAGSIAGNLMLKHAHREFPSDAFIVFATVGTKLNILNCLNGEREQLDFDQFWNTEMRGRLILSLSLPVLSQDHVIRTFKIMPRASNAHAYINAGFCARIETHDGQQIVQSINMLFGGFGPSFTKAMKTQDFLIGKNANDQTILQKSLDILERELVAEQDLLAPDEHYLKSVAQGLLYKFMLSIAGDQVDATVRSGSLNLERGLSSGKQDFDTDSKEWPLHQPVPKLEARAQCSGEAQYVDDIPVRPNELHGAFVVSSRANCRLDSIDPSAALKCKGVVAFLDAKSIKTGNYFVKPNSFDSDTHEEVFCSDHVLYAGQPVGLIVAESQTEALQAARLVTISYRDVQKPVLTIREAVQIPERIRPHTAFGPPGTFDSGDFEEGLARSKTIVEGEFEIGTQYHYYMETHVTACVPTEDGIDVYCSTQDGNAVQNAIADCLRIQKAKVNVQIRRLGGSYGGKISRSTQMAVASAIAAAELRRPVRLQLDLNTNMAVVGGRLPYYCKYRAGADSDGLLQAIELEVISDCGSNFNEGTAAYACSFARNCYASQAWRLRPYLVRTDTPPNTYCRAPGSTQGIAIVENVMEHVAKSLNMDPLEFRLKNLISGTPDADAMRKVIDEVRRSSDYDQRRLAVQEFNAQNRWKKRGLNLMPMLYPIDYPPFRYNVMVAIYQNGGSVNISHGGVECGQGINTKVVQVVAREFGIPLSLVTVQPTNTFTNANGSVTGGSMTSELNCYAAMKAAQELKERMRPVKEKMPDADWPTLVETCFEENVDLTARHYYTPKDDVSGYKIHGATVSEVELDVLTGEKLVRRVDIVEDAGQSLSPLVDVGQVEGAFVMGMGLWTSEKMVYDPETGRKLTDGTWNYKPPVNRDIPVDFRVTLLKNASHPFGVYRSKATGEPPLCMAATVFFALRNAVHAARADVGNTDWFECYGPATVDKLQKLTLTSADTFSYHK